MRKLLLLILLLSVIAGCSGKVLDQYDEITIDVEDKESAYETINLNQLEQLQAEGRIVLDVREENEFKDGHIRDAINHPLSKLQAGDFGKLDKNTDYIIICRSGNRSIEASNILHEAGYDLVNVSEGMTTWSGDIIK